MKKPTYCFILVVLVMMVASCAPQPSVSTDREAPPITRTRSAVTLTAVTPTVAPTLTNTPTRIPPTPTRTLTIREEWILAHEQERIQKVGEQGVAETIPALEYHGDNYYFAFDNGAVVELGPEGFQRQMQWFYENNVHAVTGDELVKWLHGEIELPLKSVVLTFDQGYRSAESIRRMLVKFEQYNMHGIFTIWVSQMNEGESEQCANDACWQIFRDAYNSGLATIGSHSMTHQDFATASAQDGLKELADSKQIIEEHIGNGYIVNILTWPFESIPSWGSRIQEIGFEAAFGGNTYPIFSNAIQHTKPEDWYKLPRVLPPNSNGVSGRPSGKNLDEMMSLYW